MSPRKLPPDPERLNTRRAEWAESALHAFMHTTGTESDNAVSDLLCDLMHFADRDSESFAQSLRRARRHYAEETSREVGRT